MASKTKQKDKGKSGGLQIRTVRTKEDRKRPSVYMRLSVNEAFKGIALFEPDPELDNNPGYFEYYDHYDKQANQYVPCSGDKCPFCAANDNPSTRALTVWYFPEAADVKDQIKVFTMNFSTINDIADEAEEEDGILGKVVRIKRLSDKGDYKVKVTSAKPLTKKDLTKALKALEEKIGEDGLEGLVMKNLKAQIERLKALEALDDDEDEEDEDTKGNSKARRGRAVAEADDDDDDDEEEDDEEEDEEEDDDEEDDDEEDEEDDDDDEEDEEDEEDDEEDEEEEEDEQPAELKDKFTVVSTNESAETITVKLNGKNTKLYVGEGVDVDYETVKKGVEITVTALQDEDGDWVISEFKAKKAKAGKK